MANFVQRLLYNLSAVTPVSIVFLIVWIIQKKTYILPLITVLVFTLVLVFSRVSFWHARKNVSTTRVRVVKATPKDGWIVLYIVSYLIPFVNMNIKDTNLVLLGIMSALIVIVLGYTSVAIPNPVLLFMRYHFYEIESATGISGQVLITRRKIRTVDAINVKQIYEFLLLETED